MIFYIGFFHGTQYRRQCVLAATNKMDYITTILSNLSNNIEMVSCGWVLGNRSEHGSCIVLKNGVRFRQFFSFGHSNKIINLLNKGLLKFQLLVYLIVKSHKNDTVIVYHSPFYCRLLRCLKTIKKWKLILEVEEIYGDVSGNKRLKKRELGMCQAANSFIFPTSLLSDVVNPSDKPYIVIHGTYQVEADRGVRFNDDKIHVVYAGTFDPRKGGAAAAAAGMFLSEKYHIHIIGFGSDADKRALLSTIEEVSKKSKCTVTYDGLKSGEEYIRFIQSCDIGLSTQNPNAAFNDTSFPSKILSYLANGLHVVSIRIPAVAGSAVGGVLSYYDEQTPQKIAEAIMRVDLDKPYDSRNLISELDKKFVMDLGDLLLQ